MDEGICYLDPWQIDYDASVPRPPMDAYELFCYVHLELRSPAQIPPLHVRFDPKSAKYLIIREGPSYTDEGFLLEAARSLGLSTLPCRIHGAAPLTSEERSPRPSFRNPQSLLSSTASPETGRRVPDPSRFEFLFRELCQALANTSKGVRRRTRRSALRIADDDDWRQEALLALWRELSERRQPRFACASEARKYVWGVLRNQAARTMKVGGQTSPLPEGWTQSTEAVVDELIAAEEDRCFDEAVEGLQTLMEQANKALDDSLSRLPAREATAAGAWLNGAGYRTAGLAGGLTLAQMRRVVREFRRGVLASLLHRARRDLEAIYRAHPPAAARINLGRLTRLLADPDDHP